MKRRDWAAAWASKSSVPSIRGMPSPRAHRAKAVSDALPVLVCEVSLQHGGSDILRIGRIGGEHIGVRAGGAVEALDTLIAGHPCLIQMVRLV